VALAQQLEHDGHEADALEGARSQFDVRVNGKLVFSKEREHRFPEYEEIAARL
jgi:selT/selW/selH-like putative selenoprotein